MRNEHAVESGHGGGNVAEALASRPTGGTTRVAIAQRLQRHVPEVTVREI
jgi:hypothetical protein